MPSKLEAYLHQYRQGKTKNIKLPSIYQHLINNQKLINKKQQKPQHDISQHFYNELIYSKNKQKSINIIKNRNRKLMTQHQSIQNYNKLSKIEQNIIMQIKNIDICLQNQKSHQKDKFKTALYNGFIFLNEVNELVIQKFHEILKIQSQASNAIVEGFQMPKFVSSFEGQTSMVQAEIVKKVTSINHRLLDKSIKTIQNYDNTKTKQYEQNYGKQWSLFKRMNTQQSKRGQCADQKKQKQLNQTKDSKVTFVRSFDANKKYESRSTKLFQSKMTNHSKNTFINDFSFMKQSRNTKKSNNSSIKTQPSLDVIDEKRNLVVNLTKRDVKLMLSKYKNIISIWIPPASYPQFYGLFTYNIIKSQKPQFSSSEQNYIKDLGSSSIPQITIYRCKINRYFFYRFGLNSKIFDGILEWVEKQNNIPIQQLEITVEKTLYTKTFSKMGWVLKFWQSANKVKAVYDKSLKQKSQNNK